MGRGLRADFLEDGTHSIVNAKCLTTDQLLARQQAFGIVAQINDDIVAGHFLDCAGNQLTDAIYILFNHLCTLGIAHTLHDNLLGRLRCNTAEADVLDMLS